MGSRAPLGKKDLFNTPGVELPGYIREIARELMKNGKDKSKAIQIAIGVVKNWAEGKGGVTPETRAKAAEAVAAWEKAKATARATPNKADLSNPGPKAGMIALEVPAGAIPPMDGGEDAEELHLTLAYLGDDVSDRDFAGALSRALTAAQEIGPISGSVGGLGVFPPKDGKQAVWATVDAPGVSRMRDYVQMRQTGGDVHGFTPHITLKWIKEGGKLPAPLPETPITFTHVVVERGDQKFRFALGGDYREYSNPLAVSGRQVLLARPAEPGPAAKKKAPSKASEEKRKEAGKLPPGATGWKHGWIPVDDSGKAVGPSQKPQWLKDAEAKHAAAGGKTADQLDKEKVQAEFKRKAEKAAAPAKKAKAEAEKKKREAETAARKKATEAKRKKSEAERKTKAEDRAAAQKKAERDRQVNAAYKQALADRKAGRELSEQQKRVVAYVEAEDKKRANKLRSVDVPGVDGSKVAGKLPAKTTTGTKTAYKTAAKTALRKAVAKKAAARPAPKVRAKSYTTSRYGARSVTLSADGVNALEFSAAHPKGHLAFRYKHGWILINPAIPSRGRLGGGLAKQHGHKSGGVTHGHFAPHPSGKGKVFVPDRHGGQNNPAKLKAAHTPGVVGGKINYTKPDQSKFKLAAAEKGGTALKPSTPSPEKVKETSAAANAASATANKSKSLHDAQVAAKKHADAFVQAKKAGDDKLAQSHKENAQAWAKKAGQLKTAEKASADAKKKYDAEQKAKADADKAAAEKKAAQQKAEAEKKAAMQKAAAEKQAKLEAQSLGDDAFAAMFKAQDNPTAENWNAAAKKFQAAGKKYGEVGDNSNQALYFDNASKAMKKYHELNAAPPAAPKAEPAPDSGSNLGPAMTKAKKLEGLANHIDEVMDEHDFMDAGSSAAWDDYLHASAKYKVDPTPANLKKLAAAQKKLTEEGVTTNEMQAKNSQLFKKMGLTAPAKKTAAKKTAAKKTAAKPPEPEFKAEDFKVTLPGPGMYKDGNAVTGAYQKAMAETNPAKKAALEQAADNAAAAFKAKHGKEFDKSKVENISGGIAPAAPFVPSGGDHISEHPFYADAKASGYTPVPNHVNANDGWKPSDVPGLKSTKGVYTYSGGSYTSINAHLRGPKGAGKPGDPKVGQWAGSIAQMDKEFAAVPGLKQDTVTIRKMDDEGPFSKIPPYMEPGGVFIDPGYSSTSKDPAVWSGSVHMQVRMPAGTKAIDLNHTAGSQNASEQEILLNRNTKYKVISDGPGHSPGIRLIVVEVVQ